MVNNYEVAVVGAGVFGAWTAYQLRRQGHKVLLLDAYGPGNSRSSSGGESRIIRLGYGPDEIYTRSAQRSQELWLKLFEETEQTELLRRTGVLWLAHEHDSYCEATLSTLQRAGAACERLERDELGHRFPQLAPGPASWGIWEPDAGVLMARRAVQAVVTQARAIGVDYQQARITAETQINAERVVFACGPWLPKVFPELLGELIHVTKQEVFFFGVPAGDDRFGPESMPAWIDFNDLVYGIPNLDGRGFKMAIDAHGPEFDPDAGERVVSETGLQAARAYLAQRVPLLTDAPVLETRVCQYENTSNGDFLIDRHPELENVWLVGGGSGHGFKHGPAVGEYVASIMSGRGTPEPRFSLVSKQKVQNRQVY
jgi:monomeric sarcosine oxidase